MGVKNELFPLKCIWLLLHCLALPRWQVIYIYIYIYIYIFIISDEKSLKFPKKITKITPNPKPAYRDRSGNRPNFLTWPNLSDANAKPMGLLIAHHMSESAYKKIPAATCP
jgi:hypothetical protein